MRRIAKGLRLVGRATLTARVVSEPRRRRNLGPWSPVDDRTLIARVLAGDPTAERALYDAHVDRVFRLVYRLAGDRDRAQDYTQETFIRAFAKLAEFRGEAALSTWICSIAVSVALNGLRKVKRLRNREVELEVVEPALPGATRPAAEPDLKERLAQAIDDLPEGYRTVFRDARRRGLHPRGDRPGARRAERHLQGPALPGTGQAPHGAGRFREGLA